MKKILLILLIVTGFLSAQTFIVKTVKGDVKAQIGVSEKWHSVKKGEMLKSETTLMINKNSDVVLVFGDKKFKIKNSAIVSLKRVKKLTVDELLLALAMENLIDVKEKTSETILELKKDLQEIKEGMEKMKLFMGNISREFPKFARKDDLEILSKQLKMFQPLQYLNK